jgi:hypothetical protein
MNTHTLTGAINDLWHKADEIGDIAQLDREVGNITEDQYYFQMEEVDELQKCAEILEDYKNGKSPFVFLVPIPGWAEERGEEWQLLQQELENECPECGEEVCRVPAACDLRIANNYKERMVK